MIRIIMICSTILPMMILIIHPTMDHIIRPIMNLLIQSTLILISHPTMEYEGPDILAWTQGSGLSRTNTVVMSNKELDWARPDTQTGMLDRSPCGSGTASVMALLHHKGELELGQTFTHRSVIGTEFTGQLTATTRVGEYEAVIPVITGRGWLTAVSDIVVEADDPFPTGYTVGDIW